ncbi:MAG: CPBP family glutamic-type intramembrane protease [Armatimonadota bacterium]
MAKGRLSSGTVAIIGLAILAALFQFNRQHVVGDEYIVTNITGLLFLPMVLILLVLREEPAAYGWTSGEGRGYKLAGILFALILPLLFWAATKPEYRNYYPMNPSARDSLTAFIRFELVYGVYLLCWEFFFRGFLLFGFSRSIGLWGAVFAQAIPFGIMHYGKPEFAGSFVSGLVLGWLAARSKSFAPCFALHWAISITFDILVLRAGGVSFFT